MAATFVLKARSAPGESIFIVGKLVTWKTAKSENETDFLRIQIAHVESLPIAEKGSSRDARPHLNSVCEKGRDSFQSAFAQLPFLSWGYDAPVLCRAFYSSGHENIALILAKT